MRWITAAVLLISSFAFPSLSALIVYVSDYDSESIIDLPAAQKDAIKMKSFLQTLPDSHVSLLENPTAGELIREFKKWASVEADTKIFYYAGHGISKGGKFYFIPADADPEDEYTWVPFERLKGYVPSGVKVIWLIDACYSGSMVKGRPLRVLRVQKEALSVTGDEVIITSSSGNEISRELPDGSGGIFTAALVEGLKGAADEDGNGWIESGELYEYVREKVEELSMGQQHPVMVGPKDFKITLSISSRLENLKLEIFRAYDSGKISELAYRNTQAIINGKICKGEGYTPLKSAISDYLSGKITIDALILIVKAYGEKAGCIKAQEKLTYVKLQPKELSAYRLEAILRQISGADDRYFVLEKLEELRPYYPDVEKVMDMVEKDEIDFKKLSDLTLPSGLKKALEKYHFNSRRNTLQVGITYIPEDLFFTHPSRKILAVTYTHYFKIVFIPTFVEIMFLYDSIGDYVLSEALSVMLGVGNKYLGISGGIGYPIYGYGKFIASLHIYLKYPIYFLRIGVDIGFAGLSDLWMYLISMAYDF